MAWSLRHLFKKAGIDPDYYLVFDSSSDLPYDFYRPGEEEERLPIHLLMPNNELRELSRHRKLLKPFQGKREPIINYIFHKISLINCRLSEKLKIRL